MVGVIQADAEEHRRLGHWTTQTLIARDHRAGLTVRGIPGAQGINALGGKESGGEIRSEIRYAAAGAVGVEDGGDFLAGAAAADELHAC